MKIEVGDLVKLRNNSYHGELVGVVVGSGEETNGMYGGGVGVTRYVDVQWFNKKYHKTARFQPGFANLKVVSKASRIASRTRLEKI